MQVLFYRLPLLLLPRLLLKLAQGDTLLDVRSLQVISIANSIFLVSLLVLESFPELLRLHELEFYGFVCRFDYKRGKMRVRIAKAKLQIKSRLDQE